MAIQSNPSGAARLPISSTGNEIAQRTLGATLKKYGSIAINFLSFGKLCDPSALTDRHISAISNFKMRKLIAFPQKSNIDKTQPVEDVNTLDGMRTFAREMMELTIKCVQEQYIDAQVKQFNEAAARFPGLLKVLAKEAISIGPLSSKPIFEIITNYKVDKIDKIHETLDWALKDIKCDSAEIKDELLRRINEFVPADSVSFNLHQSNVCADKILKWLLISDHRMDPYTLFENKMPKTLITAVIQTILQILIEKKIDLYKDKTHQILQNELPTIVEETILKNAITITDTLSERMAEVITNMGEAQFTLLFDKIIEISGNHVTNLSKSHEVAERTVRDHQALKEFAQNIVDQGMQNLNESEKGVFDKCKEYLDNLQKKGDIAGIKEDILFEEFLKLTGNKAPCNVTESISKHILEILLPPVTKDGKNVNGLENLLSQLEFPQQFKELFDEAKEIAKQFINKEQFAEWCELGKTAEKFKELAFDSIVEIIKLGLNEAIDLVVKHMTKPAELNLVLTNDALPSALGTMFKFFVNELIEANVSELGSLLHRLPDENAKEELLEELFKIAQKEAVEFGFTQEHREIFDKIVKRRIDDIAELLILIREDPEKTDLPSTINIVKQYYKHQKKSKDNNTHFADFINIALRTGDFGMVLPYLFKLNFARHMVSKLMTHSVRNIRTLYQPGLNIGISVAKGKYFKEQVIKKLITPKRIISDADIAELEKEIKELGSEINELRKSVASNDNNSAELKKKQKELGEKEHKCEKLEEKLNLTRKTNEEIETEHKLHADALANAQKELPNQVDRVARLGYDMLMFKAKQNVPLIGTFFLKQVLGPTAEKLIRVALTLFNKIAGRQVFNEHLLSKIFLSSVMGINMTTATGKKPLMQSTVDVPVRAEFPKVDPFKVEIKNPLEENAIWKRIETLVNKIIALFQWLTTKKMHLNNHQLRLINSIGKKRNPEDVTPPSTPPKKPKNKAHQIAEPEDAVEEVIQEKRRPVLKDENPNLNSSLQKVGDFVSQFIAKISKATYRVKIEPVTKIIVDNAGSLADQALNWLNRIIQPLAANTIVKTIGQNGYKVLDEPTRAFLDILLKNLKNNPNHSKEITSNLRLINGTVRVDDDYLPHYIEPIHAWMTQVYGHKEKIRSLADCIEDYKKAHALESFQYSDEAVSKFYIAGIQWLIKVKIESFVGTLKTFLEKQLPGLIKTHFDKNMQHMSKLVFNRVAGLANDITDEQYKELFDDCAKDVNAQMANLISAKMQASKNIPEEQKKNPELLRGEIAKELAAEDRSGQPKYVLPSLARSMLFIPTGLEINAHKASEENKAFLQIAERMIKLAFPSGQEIVHDQTRTFDAFQDLWDNFIVESSVEETIKEMHQFFRALLPAKYVGVLDTVLRKVMNMTKKFVLNSVKNHATKVLAKKLRQTSKLVSDDKKRKELIVENFHIIYQQLLKSSANLMANQLKPEECQKLFKRMIAGEEQNGKLIQEFYKLFLRKLKLSGRSLTETEETFKITPETFISNYLPEIVKGFTVQVLKAEIIKNRKIHTDLTCLMGKLDDSNALSRISDQLLFSLGFKTLDELTSTSFKIYLLPLISSIVNELIEKQKASTRDKNQAIEIQGAIENYFQSENDKNTQYVKIINNISQLGEIDHAFLVGFGTGLFESRLTDVLLRAMHPVRASIRRVTELTNKGLMSKFLQDKYVENLVNPQTKESWEAELIEIDKSLSKISQEQEQTNDRKKMKTLKRKFKELGNLKTQIKENIEKAEVERAKEDKRQSDINTKFDKGLELTSRILFDLLEDHMNKWAFKGLRFVTPDASALHEVMLTFYQNFFDNSDLLEALQVNITEKVLTLMESKT